MKPLILWLLVASLLSLPAGAQAIRKQPPSVLPSEILKKPATYLDKPTPVRGYPLVEQEPGTGIWKGTADGVKVEMTAEAKAYYEKAKPTGITPFFSATLRRRGSDYILVYEKGLPLKRPGESP